MRQYLDIIERANSSQPLFESLLLEYDTFGKQELAPAFAALYEAVSKKETTDRILAAVLAHHKNNISDAVEAIKQHKAKASATTAPGDIPQQPDTKEPEELRADPESSLQTSKAQGALSQVKSALDKWYTLANRKVPLVSDADSWVDNQIKKNPWSN